MLAARRLACGPRLVRRAAPLAARAMAGDAAAPPAPPRYTLLTYKYVPDILDKRGPHRAAHLAAAADAKAAGLLAMAGALADPVDGGLFIFTPRATAADVEAYAKNDAYVKADLVTEWSVRPWMVVGE